MIVRRHRLAVVWLSVLALLAQLVLPMAHASAWAKRNGDPLLYGFCGELSPTLLKKLEASAPAELLKRLKADHAKLEKLSCDLCGTAHGVQLATAGDAPVLGLPALPDHWKVSLQPTTAGRRIVDPHRARGPPQYSRV